MLCKYCINQAELICGCLDKICEKHVVPHIKNCKLIKITKIENIEKLRFFSIELTQRITKLNDACCDIIKNTEIIIISIIKKLCQKSVKKLKK